MPNAKQTSRLWGEIMTIDRSDDTIPAFIVEGARVAWDTWAGVATVTVTSVTPFRVFYESEDGVGGFWEACCFYGIGHAMRHLRPASV